MLRFLFVLMNEHRLWGAPRALERLERRWPGAFDARVYSVREVNADAALEARLLADAEEADMAVVASHGSIQNLFCFTRLWERLEGRRPVYFSSTMGDELSELLPRLGLPPQIYAALDSYYQAGGAEDLAQLMLCAANACFGGDYPLLPPAPPCGQGVYTQQGFLPPEAEEDYRARMGAETRPVIGVLIHDHYAKTGNLEHVDALLRAIEARGCAPYAVSDSFAADHDGERGLLYRMERAYRRPDGTAIPAALVAAYGFSITTLSGRAYQAGRPPESVVADWGLPVIQALTTYFSADEYRRDVRGLDLVSLPICVYQPEFDGQLISVPFAVTEHTADGRKVCRPLPGRVERVAELACRWAALARKPMEEKRIAVIFHNMPPRNDTIGSAHGLDTPETVYQVVRALEARGLRTAYSFESGAEIIGRIRAAVTNDGRWLSPEAALARAAATVDAAQYQTWFGRLPPETQAQMEEAWGPAPGTVMAADGRIVIPGILNGSLFVGVQPLRAAPEQAEALYHSTDSTPPHSYLAFYRWVDEVFKADAVLHVGTHGTLEWLPGKEIGLSGGCFGDICIGGMPHLYIYNIDIVGEGMQAKRRSYACVTDHLIPSMDESDTYGALTTLDQAVDEYYHALQARPAQAPELAQRIFALAVALELTGDLKTDRAGLEADPAAGVGLIHRWVSRIKTSMTRDGLHIFGRPPEGERFDQLARALVRVPNGAVPALNDSILAAQGWDAEALRAEPERLWPDGRTGRRIQDGAVDTARRIFARLSGAGYDPGRVPEILAQEDFPGDAGPLRTVLDYVCRQVVPRLEHTRDEMALLLAGFDGRFVPPLPGGSPSRGNVHILPTGRNFYAIDPAAVPSRAAWSVGRRLAEQAISAYRAEKGEQWPESVAIVVYSDECMKTHGEDVAEVFALMGVRPVYLGQSSKVVGVQPIPLAELGRPRIDAVLRISGLFRDTFPNVVELVERAVLAVAALDEDPEWNFVKKHTDRERERLVAEGLSENEAADRAALRVFGCPPGTYGAGVSKAVHSRNWESWEDLSRVYALWSCHGYSSRFHGQAMPELFRSRLSTVGVTVKNESSVEIDMLDSDDFYSYHGGLIACVRASSGEKPVAVAGLTADPERPETTCVETELARVMRSRILNPKWLEGLKRHGYKGAQEISTTFDTLFGWDASAQAASNWMYDAMARRFLLEEETRKWMEQVNDAAVLQLSERLLEAHQRGMWQAQDGDLKAVRRIYMDMEGVMEDGYQ